jgi:hypothetical protein
VILRFVLLVVLAVAMVTGRVAATDISADASAELTEPGAEDAVLAQPIVLDARIASPAPRLVHGTEVEHASPPPARVFRPPRAASVRIA